MSRTKENLRAILATAHRVANSGAWYEEAPEYGSLPTNVEPGAQLPRIRNIYSSPSEQRSEETVYNKPKRNSMDNEQAKQAVINAYMKAGINLSPDAIARMDERGEWAMTWDAMTFAERYEATRRRNREANKARQQAKKKAKARKTNRQNKKRR